MSEEMKLATDEVIAPDLSHLADFLKDAITSVAPNTISVPLNEDGEFVNVYSFEEGQAVGNLKIKVLEDAIVAWEDELAESTTKFITTVEYSTGTESQRQSIEHATGEEVSFLFTPSEDLVKYNDVYFCLKAIDGTSNDTKAVEIEVS